VSPQVNFGSAFKAQKIRKGEVVYRESQRFWILECPNCETQRTRYRDGKDYTRNALECEGCGFRGIMRKAKVPKATCRRCSATISWKYRGQGVWEPLDLDKQHHYCQQEEGNDG